MEEVCVVVRYHHIYLPSHLPNSPEHDTTNTSVSITLPPGSSLIAVVKLKPERVQQLLLVQEKNNG